MTNILHTARIGMSMLNVHMHLLYYDVYTLLCVHGVHCTCLLMSTLSHFSSNILLVNNMEIACITFILIIIKFIIIKLINYYYCYFFLQIAEKFVLGLYSEGPAGQKGVLGTQITINVTIKENDDPHGVFGFRAPNLIKIIGTTYLSEYTTHCLKIF